MNDTPLCEPQPRFEPRPDDPDWLIEAVRMHGHLGPWLVVGLRLGQAVLADLGSRGFFDIHVVVTGPIQKPPPRCILDGLQFATGATLGKGNIDVVAAERFEIRATNTTTGQEVCYGLRDELVSTIRRVSPDAAEDLARRLARQPFDHVAFRTS